ncbi:MAG: HEPN domain-containing protein [Candidatus Methanoperedens sp.]|nr:HEPN domain-containing protein [Candidatus Methanoperedens sp.]
MKMAECFQKGLLKRTSPDMENALRSLELSKSNIEDAVENMSIHRYRVVAISSYSSMFHAARAILFRDGIKERSHECIPVYLKERYPELETLANILIRTEDSGTTRFMGLISPSTRERQKLPWNLQKNFLKK